MVIPYRFVAGLLIGAISTYVYKDDSARQRIKDAGSKLKDGAKSFVESFGAKSEVVAESAAGSADVIDSTAENITDTASTNAAGTASKANKTSTTAKS